MNQLNSNQLREHGLLVAWCPINAGSAVGPRARRHAILTTRSNTGQLCLRVAHRSPSRNRQG
jgi:hypothetical protein